MESKQQTVLQLVNPNAPKPIELPPDKDYVAVFEVEPPAMIYFKLLDRGFGQQLQMRVPPSETQKSQCHMLASTLRSLAAQIEQEIGPL
jgi:hypothetical protein